MPEYDHVIFKVSWDRHRASQVRYQPRDGDLQDFTMFDGLANFFRDRLHQELLKEGLKFEKRPKGSCTFTVCTFSSRTYSDQQKKEIKKLLVDCVKTCVERDLVQPREKRQTQRGRNLLGCVKVTEVEDCSDEECLIPAQSNTFVTMNSDKHTLLRRSRTMPSQKSRADDEGDVQSDDPRMMAMSASKEGSKGQEAMETESEPARSAQREKLLRCWELLERLDGLMTRQEAVGSVDLEKKVQEAVRDLQHEVWFLRQSQAAATSAGLQCGCLPGLHRWFMRDR